MRRTVGSFASTLAAAVFLILAGAGPASATTFCVPDFHAGCPNNGTNVKQANLEQATMLQGSDGIADTVLVGETAYVDPDTLDPVGSDPLKIVGSGTGKTTISSSSTGNIFVANFGDRPSDVSDLTIVIPASFPDSGGNGGAVQAKDGNFDRVDIRSLNPKSQGAESLLGNTVWKNSRIYGAAGGSIQNGIAPNDIYPGKLEIINTTIENSIWGLSISGSNVPVVMKRSRIVEPVGYGAYVTKGGLLVMENSIVEGAGLEAINAQSFNQPGETDIDVSVRASTFIAEPSPNTPAIQLKVGGSHDVSLDVSDSILSGYENTWLIDAPFGPGLGNADLSFTFSDFKPLGLPDGVPNVDLSGPGNINVDPELNSDLTLKTGSPAIDSGGPETGATLDDYAGNVRPQDGDGDGIFVRDMGAFEAPTIATCKNTPALCPTACETDPTLCPPPPDTVKPKISKVRFRAPKGKKAGSLRLKISEKAKVIATFKRIGNGKKRPKLVRLVKQGKSGANKFKIRKGKLKPGRYKLSIFARDLAGNRSRTVTRKVKV